MRYIHHEMLFIKGINWKPSHITKEQHSLFSDVLQYQVQCISSHY